MSDFNAEHQKQTAAVATLESMNYTWLGGVRWKPPIGKTPDFDFLDQNRAEIERFEKHQAASCGTSYANFKAIADNNEKLFGCRYPEGSRNDEDWQLWQAATAQVVPQGEMFYALKDEYFEEQYFELGGVIDDFKSDYATGEICELLCADITTIKRPNKFIVTLPGGETRVFDTREEAMQAIQAAREGE